MDKTLKIKHKVKLPHGGKKKRKETRSDRKDWRSS